MRKLKVVFLGGGGGRSDNLNEEIANLKKLIKDKKE